ncbi:hypothetical protein ACNA7A_17600, partial [Deinococcus sp. ME38]
MTPGNMLHTSVLGSNSWSTSPVSKAGKFSGLSDWMHVLNAVHGVHLVVLHICCGDLKLPWAFQIWCGKATSSPAALALKLLRTIPPVMLQGKR